MESRVKMKPDYIKDRLTAWFDDSEDISSNESGWLPNSNESDYSKANLVTSRTMTLLHLPVIDIDLPCKLEPSTSDNCYHLYINKEVKWEDYIEMLQAMAKCGIVQQGWVNATVHRGYSAVRKPGHKKKFKDGN